DGDRAGRHDLVQLAQNLLRRLEPRIAAVQPGNVAELARVRAAARELDARDEVLSQPDEGVRGHGKVRHGQALHRLEAAPTRRPTGSRLWWQRARSRPRSARAMTRGDRRPR